MYWKQIVSFVVAAGTAGFAMGAQAQEQEVKRSEVPEAVLKAVEARYPGATLRRFETEKENGRLVYEVALESKSAHLEVMVSPEGRILVEEQSIGIDEAPEAVRKGLASSKYGRAEVVGVERVTEVGKAMTFELVVNHEGTEHELVFSENGELQKDEAYRSEEPGPASPRSH